MISRFFLFSAVSLFCFYSQGQISVGLKESALGNSGVALTESSAPAYYNPALLSEKSKNYFSITGTTLNYFSATDPTSNFKSTKVTPNYASSIHAFETFVHEFSLANEVSIESKTNSSIANGSQTVRLSMNRYSLAYSMAFRDFPFGFQVGLEMNELISQFSQQTDDGNIQQGFNSNSTLTTGDLFLGFGGIHQLNTNYRFGYKVQSRPVNAISKDNSDGHYYYYDQASNTFLSGTSKSRNETESLGLRVNLGHSFTWKDHEFLTDTQFVEESNYNDTYSFNQTFGYKVNFSNKWQYMCGISHRFDSNLSNLGKSNYFSSGFSWMTNSVRSTVSAYYIKQKTETNLDSAGITVGSEFTY